jgi:tetratricopeptide (TPR) repeat protein
LPAAVDATPVSKAPAVQAAPKAPPAEAGSPAVQLLAQAHEWSSSAKSVSDFTRIIQSCQQAAAAQGAPEIGRYASELGSWALNRRGQLHAEAGHEEEALSDFDAAIEADGKRWRAVHNRGVVLAGNGEFEKAFEDFSRTIQLNPRFAKAYSNRAALFVVAGNVESAIQDYSQAVTLDPQLTVAHRGLGRAFHLEGQLDASIQHYDEAVRLSPQDAYAIASRADVLTDLGRYAEASAEYDRAIAVDANSSHAHSGSAWLLATCPDDAVRNPQLAVERAQVAVELTNGEDAASLDTLAAAQASQGDFTAATATIEQAVQLATATEKQSYLERQSLYQQETPFRLEPVNDVMQINHESE